MEFEFKCASCGQIHRGMPSFGADAPLSYFQVPEVERGSRCSLGSDDCVIDGKWFFIRGCLEIPVHGEDQPFVWGVWVSLSKASFNKWKRSFHVRKRSHIGPFFGWLDAWLKPYPSTINLKTMVHLRDHGIRPWIELESTDHPLAVEQSSGISKERLAEIFTLMMHDQES